MSVQIRVDDRGVFEAFQALHNIPGAFPKAIARAANRAATQGRTKSSRIVRDAYTVKAKDVRPALRVYRASASETAATLHVSGGALSLSKFRYKPRRDTTGNRRRQVVAEMLTGSKRGVDKGFVYNGNIWARTDRFTRSDGKTQNIRVVMGSSVPRMMENRHEAVETLIREAFIQRLEHETNYILRRRG